MIEVQFRHKTAKHGLHINGKRIQFIDGKAFVSEAEADAILKMGDKDYKVLNKAEPTVVEEDKPKNKPKPKKAKRKKK